MLSVLFSPQWSCTCGQMERFLPSSMDDLTEFDPESLILSYVILKHILSEDDCLQFSYFSLSYYWQKLIMSLSMEAGCHRRFQTSKAPYYAMIKMDRTMWPWWVLILTPICCNVHWISKCLYHPLDQKVLCFRVSIYLEHLQNVYC